MTFHDKSCLNTLEIAVAENKAEVPAAQPGQAEVHAAQWRVNSRPNLIQGHAPRLPGRGSISLSRSAVHHLGGRSVC